MKWIDRLTRQYEKEIASESSEAKRQYLQQLLEEELHVLQQN
jgi:hypothetical protein